MLNFCRQTHNMMAKFPHAAHCNKLLLLAVLFSWHLSAQQPSPFIGEVDSLVQQKMKEYEIPGLAIGIVQDGSTLVAKGYGVKNIDDQSPVDERTTFHTASISKLLTAQATVQLLYRRDLPLNSRLADLIPDLNYKEDIARQITVKQLLNHSSGLPDIKNYQWQNQYTSDQRLEEYAKSLELEVDFGPGIEFSYSNLGYNLLAYLIQDISGLQFEDYVEQYIMEPAGMMESDFRYFNTPEDNRASPHTRKRVGKKVSVRKTYPYSREHAGSSTLNASVRDLNSWMIHFMKALESGQYKSMIEPSLGSYQQIGLGFQLGQHYGMLKAGHYGGDRGFRSYLFIIPEKNLGLVLLANCDYNEDFRQEILHPLASYLILNKPK